MTESKELQIWKEMFQDAGPVERRLLWAHRRAEAEGFWVLAWNMHSCDLLCLRGGTVQTHTHIQKSVMGTFNSQVKVKV